MEKQTLTIWLPRDLLEGAERYARKHKTTLTRLVSEYLRQLVAQDDPLANAPTVRRMSGTLSQKAMIKEYCEYLKDKHSD
jgi:hypothetical protein